MNTKLPLPVSIVHRDAAEAWRRGTGFHCVDLVVALLRQEPAQPAGAVPLLQAQLARAVLAHVDRAVSISSDAVAYAREFEAARGVVGAALAASPVDVAQLRTVLGLAERVRIETRKSLDLRLMGSAGTRAGAALDAIEGVAAIATCRWDELTRQYSMAVAAICSANGSDGAANIQRAAADHIREHVRPDLERFDENPAFY